jgi:hypothetical protein
LCARRDVDQTSRTIFAAPGKAFGAKLPAALDSGAKRVSGQNPEKLACFVLETGASGSIRMKIPPAEAKNA